MEWKGILGGSNAENAASVIQTLDSGYIVAGLSGSNDGDVSGNHGITDDWIVKLKADGSIQWQKCYGGTSGDNATDIKQTNDSGYIITGSSNSNDGDVSGHHGLYNDYWVVKLDTIGNIQWQKSFGGFYDDNGWSIQQTSDNGYIAGGSSYSSDGDITKHYGDNFYDDYWIVKLDTAGNIQWQETLGGTDFDQFYGIMQTADEGYIVSGYTNSNDSDVTNNHGGKDCWIVKLEQYILPVTWVSFNGTLQNNEAKLVWTTGNETNNKGFEVERSADGKNFIDLDFVKSNAHSAGINYYVYTDPKTANGLNYYRLKQIDNDGRFNYSSIIQLDYTKFDWSVTGNPSMNNYWVNLKLGKGANISIQLISMQGKVLQTITKDNLSAGSYSIPLHSDFASSGIYIVRLLVNNNAYIKKMAIN